MTRHPQILNKKHTALLIVDIQQRINAVMQAGDMVVANTIKLIKACRILNIPIFITEQYPKGLGPTEPVILEALADVQPMQKMSFSCCSAEKLLPQLNSLQIKQVIVTGIESHVCVLQTAFDLIANDYQVHIPKEAVSSRKEIDYQTALARMSKAGIIITTVESVLFELLETAGTPEFKEITKLIK